MPQDAAGIDTQRLLELQEQLQQYIQERLKAVELQLSLEQQRQRNHFDAEFYTLRQHLADVVRDQQQQQQKAFATCNEAVEELRKEISEVLQHLSRDLDRAVQGAEAHGERALERLRTEMFETVREHDKSTVKNHLLGELLITLGKQLQGTPGLPRKLITDGQ